MAITKERKEEILATYTDWFKRSQAVILVEYTGAQDEGHGRHPRQDPGIGWRIPRRQEHAGAPCPEEQGMSLPDEVLLKSSAMSFAFTDPAATAKALADATKGMGFVKVKGGFMAGQLLDATQVKALAELPPLPVVRARLLGMLQAPASQLVRTIAEPARSLAAVVRAYSEKAAAPA